MSHDLFVSNVRPMDLPGPVNIVIEGGVITAIGPDVSAPSPGTPALDGDGALVFPAFVDAHTHIDKTLLGLPWHRHDVGPTLMDKIVNERRLVKEMGLDSHERSMEQVRREVASGTTAIRTFSDVNTEWGLEGFRGLLRTREAVGDLIDLQIVVFPQSGMLIRPGTVELMDQAMAEGADVVGGIDPCSVDRDPAGHIDTIFRLAEKHDADVDIHLHEPGELGAFSLELIMERTRALGWQGRVVISHGICLGGVDDTRLRELAEGLVELDIVVMSHAPGGHRAIPNIALLRSLGVRMCSGNDGVRDAWGPLNRPDMLQRAYIMAYRNNLRRDDDIEELIRIITTGSAAAMRLPKHGIEAGARGDLVLVDSETHVEAVIEHPPRRAVVRAGRVVAEHGALTVDL
jgi:cytosine/adenosine deaminase-related metal-dependent hydrolase